MPVKLIAEIGWNHMGNRDRMVEMIRAAKESGADVAKFQYWREEELRKGPWDNDGRRQIYKKAQLEPEDLDFLRAVCRGADIEFMCSVFSYKHVPFFIEDQGIKVPGLEINNYQLLKEISMLMPGVPVYLSTGTATLEEIEDALGVFKDTNEVTVMHCTSVYPCPPELCNLKAIDTLTYEFPTRSIGYSGHYSGIDDAIIAVTKGVTVIEKHFTINHSLPGRDNKFAILPHQMKALSDFIKNYETMLGNGSVHYLEEETECRDVYRGRWLGGNKKEDNN